MAIHEDIDHTGIDGALPAVGDEGDVLTVSSGVPAWEAPEAVTTVATDAIWDAAGDLAVGSGANTAARLALGAAGGALSVINSAVAWNSGTSFPGSVATGDRYWRTDLGLEFYWDGTQWVTTQLFQSDVANEPHATPTEATATFRVASFSVGGAYGIYLVRLDWSRYIVTNNGTDYWTLDLKTGDSAGTMTSRMLISSQSQTQAAWDVQTNSTGVAVAEASCKSADAVLTKVASGGAVYWALRVFYRIIAT